MGFVDRELTCVKCGRPFIFSAGEQAFFRDKGFRYEPKHCKRCKAVPLSRPQRWPTVETQVICAECGEYTSVPFNPHLNVPVFCRACFNAKVLSFPKKAS